ncbi:phage tail protein [Chromobacterium sinusclupearum]|uniref:Phage tail protein n=1 Tax=Chromobacterium sinusclupearum TaxID=2077146 RepID=A0A2K4MJA2_9NEIS|nr:phage tail protein [Chromobacterium sinusclupearum]POA97150.1 phage tail protein [Chromobacterium sinusclupearum]
MNKPADLRRAIEAALPALRDNPDRLIMLVEDGGIVTAPGRLHFGYRYTLKLVITDFTGHLDQLIIPLRAWIEQNEPPLVQNPERLEKGFRFEVEWISATAVDVQITLLLSEGVRVEVGQDGNVTATHYGESAEPFAGVEYWTITVKGETVYDNRQA